MQLTKSTLVTPVIERCDIREEVVQPVSVRRVLSRIPIFRQGELSVESTFCLRFVVDRIETDDSLEEDVKLGMRGWIGGDLEERLEDIYCRQLLSARSKSIEEERLLTPDDFFEIFDSSTLLEDVVQSRNLNEPSNIVRKEFVLDDPFRKLVPFFGITVSGKTLHDQSCVDTHHTS